VFKVDGCTTLSPEGVLLEREYTTNELGDFQHIMKQFTDDSHLNDEVDMNGYHYTSTCVLNTTQDQSHARPSCSCAILENMNHNPGSDFDSKDEMGSMLQLLAQE
ncbi:unnamed protein product, partial [Rotaria sp. Silwood1]